MASTLLVRWSFEYGLQRSAVYSNLGLRSPQGFRTGRAGIQGSAMCWLAARICRQGKLKDIVAAAKANPGSNSVATAGSRNRPATGCGGLYEAAGVKLLGSAYKGSPPAFTDLLAGRVDLVSSTRLQRPCHMCSSGQARGIAVLSSKRSLLALTCRRWRRLALPGLNVDSWLGIFVPAKPRRRISQSCRRIPCLAARPKGALREERRRKCGICRTTSFNAFVSRPNTTAGQSLSAEVGIKLM